MSITTTNYNLTKPELTDVPDITALNKNWDVIDTELKEHSDANKEFALRTTVFPVTGISFHPDDTYGILNVSVSGVTSYDDLVGKSIYVDTDIYYISKKYPMWININGYGTLQLRKIVPRSEMCSMEYEPYEIGRNLIMQLTFYKSNGSVYCYWSNALTEEKATDEIYGRVKLSDTVGDISQASKSVAATPYLVSLKADQSNSFGGFAGGNLAEATATGAACGNKATTNTGFSGGMEATSQSGAAVGAYASAYLGGAVGQNAKSNNGGAVGVNTITGDGFAGGADASTVDNETEEPIDAVQLGRGNNSLEKSLQVYDYTLMNPDGKLTFSSLPTKISAPTTITMSSGYSTAIAHTFDASCIFAIVQILYAEDTTNDTGVAIIAAPELEWNSIYFAKAQGTSSATSVTIKYRVIEFLENDILTLV